MVVENGIMLRKYFLDVSQDEQRRRFEARINDPMRHWKLSPMDTESVRRWWDYTAAYQRMIEATHTPEAPWYIVPADSKRHARLNLNDTCSTASPTKRSTKSCRRSLRRSGGPRALPKDWAPATRSPLNIEDGRSAIRTSADSIVVH
jgi:hypothetical protein